MPVSTERRGLITILTLEREDKRNAIDPEMTASLDAALNAFEDDPEQWVAIITGGPRMFSAGGSSPPAVVCSGPCGRCPSISPRRLCSPARSSILLWRSSSAS